MYMSVISSSIHGNSIVIQLKFRFTKSGKINRYEIYLHSARTEEKVSCLIHKRKEKIDIPSQYENKGEKSAIAL